MKRLFFIYFVFLAISSCTKHNIESQNACTIEFTPDEAKVEFAVVLSKAISQEKNLREFIKQEALKQFDMDYDVFYPYVKESMVNDTFSFRDLLLKYTTKETLEQIEKALPLLTIYVPDYSWIGAFSPEMWDTNDDEVVVALKEDDDLKIRYNGDVVGVIEENQFADFPLLVIKDNERLIVNTCDTRSGDCSYHFISDAFDASLNNIQTRVDRDNYYEQLYDIEEVGNYLSASELDSKVIAAYNEFGEMPGRYHRDYIYYGITNENSSGIYNNYYKEYIYKIKFSNANGGGLYDTTSGDYIDGHFPEPITKYREKNKLTIDELKDLDLRIEGKLELRVYAVMGTKNGEALTAEDTYNVALDELFAVDKVYVEERGTNIVLWRRKYVYSINQTCLVPIWYTLNKPLELPVDDSWNLSQSTPYIKIRIEEWDQGETKSRTEEFSISMANNASTETTEEGHKIGYGTTTTTTYKDTYTYSYVNSSEVFGEAFVKFTDPIIASKEGDKYRINVYTFGDMDAMILPRHI